MRGLLRAYYWMDESLQNGLQKAGYLPRTRTQTMILINISNGTNIHLQSKKKTCGTLKAHLQVFFEK